MPGNSSPGPPRSYNRDEVLDRIMLTFWEKGYAATSVRELREATGLGSRSLYDDFGNKQALFRAALHRYRERSILPLYEPLTEGESPLASLHAFLDRFESMPPADRRLGCLVGIGMAETNPVDHAELAGEITLLAEEMRDRIVEAIRAAIEHRELDTTVTPADLGALLVTALQGAHLAGRIQPDGELRGDALHAARQLLHSISTPERTDR